MWCLLEQGLIEIASPTRGCFVQTILKDAPFAKMHFLCHLKAIARVLREAFGVMDGLAT